MADSLPRGPPLTVLIRPVASRRDLSRFVGFPYSLFAHDTCWVPPLRRDEFHILSPGRNPAFAFCDVRCWLAWQDGRIVGRLAGIVNRRYVETWGRRDARFGWVDFVDGPEVSAALFAALEDWARGHGMDAVHGPLGFTDLDPEGMLVEGFAEEGTMGTIHNPPYYPLHLERLGYAKQVDWIEYRIRVPDPVPERLRRLRQRVEESLHLRTLHFRSRGQLRPFARPVLELLNQAYAGLHGFVPLDDAQIEDVIRRFFSIVQPEYVFLVLDGDERLAAFGLTMPSLGPALRRVRGRLFPFGWYHLLRALGRGTSLDLLLVGVRPDLQGRGVNALLIDECARVCIAHGIAWAESNPELETNARVQAQWKFFDARQHKRRRCYVKVLRPAAAGTGTGTPA